MKVYNENFVVKNATYIGIALLVISMLLHFNGLQVFSGAVTALTVILWNYSINKQSYMLMRFTYMLWRASVDATALAKTLFKALPNIDSSVEFTEIEKKTIDEYKDLFKEYEKRGLMLPCDMYVTTDKKDTDVIRELIIK